MRFFINKLLLFFSVLVLFEGSLLVGYLYYDPFMILYTYPNYSSSSFSLNRDYVSTEMFKKNYPTSRYNTFLFGSSRVVGISLKGFEKRLPSGAVAFSFDASAESLEGIYLKIKYLHSQKVELKNVLVLLCRDFGFRAGKHEGHLMIKHPNLSSESWWSFHQSFLLSYFVPTFFIPFYDYKFTNTYKPYMKSAGIVKNKTTIYELDNNALHISPVDEEIEKSPTAYYEKNKDQFYERQAGRTAESPQISPNHLAMLKEMKEIFEKQKTNYSIVISPLYEQVHLHKKDIEVMTKLFGNRFYDFAGKNYFTENKYHYYENSHFRPIVGDSILKIITKSQK
jgi:hypothetical protein